MPGTNAKMNEMQALMGRMVLKHYEDLVVKRKRLYDLYRERLGDLAGIYFPPAIRREVRYNYAYVPIEVDEDEFGLSRDGLYAKLKDYNIFARRYFYPLICDYACYQSVAVKDPLETARRVSERILTLPIYCDLSADEVVMTCDIISSLKK